MAAPARETRLLPWPQLMRLGLHVLRLRPDDFWAMTPRELAAAAGLTGASGAPRLSELDALLQRFPDGDDRDR